MTDDDNADRPDGPASAEASAADVEAVREAALGFVDGLTDAFGFDDHRRGRRRGQRDRGPRRAATSLGLLIGPGGRTLLAIQDLARVAAQRRLGDHDTRLRIDVAGYREKRRVALERFAGDGRRAGEGERRRPLARPDAVGRPQGAPRRARRDRRREQPVRGRGPEPPRRRHAGLTPDRWLGGSRSTDARPRRRAGVVAAPRHAGRAPDRRGHRPRRRVRRRAVADVTGTVVDLGAGGGVPGLVIATARPDLRARARRSPGDADRPPPPPRRGGSG